MDHKYSNIDPAGIVPKSSLVYLIQKTTISSLCRGLGVITGLFLDAVVLYHFGIGDRLDAFFAAYTIPLIIATILDSQVPNVLVPVLNSERWTQKNEDNSELLSAIFWIFIASLILISVLGYVSADLYIAMLVPGLPKDAAKVAASLTRLLYWTIVFRGTTAVLSACLLANHRFFLMSCARIVYNIGAICGVFFLHNTIGIYSLATGYLIGSCTQLLLIYASTCSLGFRLKFSSICWAKLEIRNLMKMMMYPIAGDLIGGLKAIIENHLASLFGTGSISTLRYGSKIVEAISGVLVSGIGTSTLPLVSYHASKGCFDDMKSAMLEAIKMIIFVSSFLGVWLVFTGESMVVLLFARGEFTEYDALVVGHVISLLVPYMLFSRLIGIIQVSFYATMDTRSPFFAGLFFISSYFVSCLLLMYKVKLYAFPISSSIAAITGCALMVIVYQKRFGLLNWLEIARFTKRLLVCIGFSCIGFFGGELLMPNAVVRDALYNLATFVIPSAMGSFFFISCLRFLGIIKFSNIFKLFQKSAQ